MNRVAPSSTAFHESARTAVSTNVDPRTGKRVQTLNTSRLSMWWENGELQVRCQASRVTMDASRGQRSARTSRGSM